MVVWILCGYIALAAAFYTTVTATAMGAGFPVPGRLPKWHRPHRIEKSMLFRRLRK